MSDQEWRDENDKKVDFVIDTITNGDEHAFNYVHDVATAARIVDDIYDEFENVTSSQVMRCWC